jgi:hypothetical protein
LNIYFGGIIMATEAVYMTSVNIDSYSSKITDNAFEYSDTLSTAGDGDAVIIPTNIKSIYVSVIPSTDSCKVQMTTDLLADVEDDPDSVNWFDWSSGTVSSATIENLNPVTAIRQVNTNGTGSGTTIMNVRCQ